MNDSKNLTSKEHKGTPKRAPPRRTSTLTDISEDSDGSLDENFELFKGNKRRLLGGKGKYLKKHSDEGTLAADVEKQAKLSSDDDLTNNSSFENVSFPIKQRQRTLVKDKYLKQPLDLKVVSNAIEAGSVSVDSSSEDERSILGSIKRRGPRVRRKPAVNTKVTVEDFAKEVNQHDVSNSTESEKEEKVTRKSSPREAVVETVPQLNNSNNKIIGLRRNRLPGRERIATNFSDFAANIERMRNEMKDLGDSTFESSSPSSPAIITPRRPLRPSGDTLSRIIGNKISMENYTVFEEEKIAKNRDKLVTKTSLSADDSNREEEPAIVKGVRVVMNRLTQSDVEAYTAKKGRSLVISKPKRSSSTYDDGVHGVLDIVEYSSDETYSKDSSKDFTGTLLQTYKSKYPSSSLSYQSSSEKSDHNETKLLPTNKSQTESSRINRSSSIINETTPVKWTANNVSIRQLRRSLTTSPRRSLTISPRRSLTISPRKSLTTYPRKSLTTYPQKSLTTYPRKSLTTSPRKSLTTSPRKSLTTSPRKSLTTSPRKSLRTSPRKSLRTSPRKSLPTSPRKSLPTSPRKSLPTSPRKSLPTSPRKSLTTSPRKSLTTSARKSLTTSPRKSLRTSPRKSVNNSFVTESNDGETSAKKFFGRSKNTSIENEDEKSPETLNKNRRQSSNSKISLSKPSSRYSTRSEDEKDPKATISNLPFTRRSLSLNSNKRHSTESDGEETVVVPAKNIQSPFRQISPSKSDKRNSIINNKENTPVTSIKKRHSFEGIISATKSNKRHSTRSEGGKVLEMTIINESGPPDKQLSASLSKSRSEEAPQTPHRNMKNQPTSGQSSGSKSKKSFGDEEAPKSPNNKSKTDSQNSLSKSRNSTKSKGEESPNSKSQASGEPRSFYSIRRKSKEDPKSSINKSKTYDDIRLDSALMFITRLQDTRNEDKEAPKSPLNKNKLPDAQNSALKSSRYTIENDGEKSTKSPVNQSRAADKQISPSKFRGRSSMGSQKGLEASISRMFTLDGQIPSSKSRSRQSIRSEVEKAPTSSVNKNRTFDKQISGPNSSSSSLSGSEGEETPKLPVRGRSSTRSRKGLETSITKSRASDKQISPSKSRGRSSMGSQKDLDASMSRRFTLDGQITGSKSRSRQSIGSKDEEASTSSVNKNRTFDKQISGTNSSSSGSSGSEGEETPKLPVSGRSSTRSRKSLETSITKNQASGRQISPSKSRGNSSMKSQKGLEASISKRYILDGQIAGSKSRSRLSIGSEDEEAPTSSVNKNRTSLLYYISGPNSTSSSSSGSESEEIPKLPVRGRSLTKSRKSLETSITKSRASGRQISPSKSKRGYSSESDSDQDFEMPIKKTQSIGGLNSGSKLKKRFSTRSEGETSDEQTSVKTLNLSKNQKKNKTIGNITADVSTSVNKGSFDAMTSTVRSKRIRNLGTNKLLENIFSPIKKLTNPLRVFTDSPADSSLLSPAYESHLFENVNSAASIRTSSPQKKRSNVSIKRSASNSLTREPEAKKPRLVQSTIQFQNTGKSLSISKKLSNSQNKSKVNTTVNKSLTAAKPAKKVVSKKKPMKKKDIGYVIPRQYVKYNAERFILRRLPPDTISAIHKASENFLKDTVKNLENQMRIEGRTDFNHRDLLKYLITIGLYKDKSDWIEWVRKYAPLDIREVLIPCARAGNVVF